MILADSSIWIDHIRHADGRLVFLLDAKQIYMHPFVVGELALGSIKNRKEVIGTLLDIPHALHATDSEVIGLIEQSSLYGRGIGFADAHLLASALLTVETRLWTRDKRLAKVATELGVAYEG